MSPRTSNRVAWSVAVAALALWASSAPVTWGQVAAGATSLFPQTADDGANTNTTTVDFQVGDPTITSTSNDDGGVQNAPCPPQPPAGAPLTPPAPVPAAPVPPAPVPPAATGEPGTFHICGNDPNIETSIAQLIGGRGFSASLSSHGDGCADLTIRPTAQIASGSSSSNLNVSLGGGRNLSIQIVSTQGATRATVTVR